MDKITFILPGSGHQPVGGFKIIYEYANRIVDQGHMVSIVHPALLVHDTPLLVRPKKWLRYFQRRVNASYMPTNWFSIDSRVKILWVPYLDAKFIPESDVIIATAWQTAEWVAKYPKPKGRKYYLIHDYEHYMTADSKTRQRIKETFRSGMCNIVTSPAGVEMLRSCGAEVNVYVPNGIDFNVFKLNMHIESKERKLIGFPSRSEEFKGTRDAIAALSILHDKLGVEFTAWSFGRSKLNYMPNWIKYHHQPNDEFLCGLYNSSAIFITASHYEGWGLPGAEAMACGAALVSTEHGGIRAYAEHEKTALLSPAKDVGSLTDNIYRLISDIDLRHKIARAGYEHIQKFTWDLATSSILKALLIH